ncbi:Proteasome maturation protein (Proteassemblin) (Protein UMP1 homolog) (mUMP1), partial [Durusdinium trenchii]
SSNARDEMEQNHEVPVIQPHDVMRNGLHSVKAELAPPHPVEKMQKERRAREMDSKMRDLTAQQGIAAAMRYQADHRLLSQYHRLPGIPSSFAGFENYTGADSEISFEDWLGEPELSPQYLANFHETMEHKLNF